MVKINIAPCTKVKEQTPKEFFAKIDEELTEFKAATILYLRDIENSTINSTYLSEVTDEALDIMTAICSMLVALGLNQADISKSALKVAEKNRARGRI